MTNENELDDLLCELSLGCGFLSYDTKVREAINLIKSQQSRIDLLESAIREFLKADDELIIGRAENKEFEQECDDLILYTLYPNALELIKSLQIEIGELKNNVMVFRDEKNLAIKRWSELSKENQSLKRNHEPEPLDCQT